MLEVKQQEWISFSIYHDQQDMALIHLLPFILSGKMGSSIIKFMFNRSWERGANLVLMFEINESADLKEFEHEVQGVIDQYIKMNPSPERVIQMPVNDWFLPFPANHIEIKNNCAFDIMETGGLKASLLAKSLLSASSKHVFQFIEEAGEVWGPESAIGAALQFHMALVSAFKLNLEESELFYDYFFASILDKTHGTDVDFHQNLLKGLAENFETQKESMLGFGEYVLSLFQNVEEIEEEWLKCWFTVCFEISGEIEALQRTGEYTVPENFEVNKEIAVNGDVQKKWPVLEYYLRSVNTQLGVNNVYELNLIYSLKQIFKELANVKANN